MKSIPIALETHILSGCTTLAHALKITRRDGEIFGFTSASEATDISGVTYQTTHGLMVTSVEQSSGFSVDNLELSTLDDGTLFTRKDIENGVWRNGEFLLFRYNWKSPGDGIEPIMAGTVGEVGRRQTHIVAELRGLQQYLQQPVGNVSTKNCRARFADYPTPNGKNLCRLNAAEYFDDLIVTNVSDDQTFSVTRYLTGDEPGDPSYDTTTLLMHFNGVNGSTAVPDTSAAPRTWTNVGCSLTTTTKQFGDSSISFPGASNCLYVTVASPYFTFGSSFTIEGWFNINTAKTTNATLIYMSLSGWQLFWRASDSKLVLQQSATVVLTTTLTLAKGSFAHVAWVREGGDTHSIYINGALAGTATRSNTVYANTLIIGATNNTGTTAPYYGLIDEVRISNIARYVGTFTVPDEEFYDFAPDVPADRPEGWYTNGIIEWVSGANAGVSARVNLHGAEDELTLQKKMLSTVSIGDTMRALAGCLQRRGEDCRDKFDNVLNFQGEPDRPGIDLITKPPVTD